jgi:hypothetical protein
MMQPKYSFFIHRDCASLSIGLGSYPVGGGQRNTGIEGWQDCDSGSSHPVGSKEHRRIEGWVFLIPHYLLSVLSLSFVV